jgi:hypothetical protein
VWLNLTVIKVFNYTSNNLYTYVFPRRASDDSIHIMIRDGKTISDTEIEGMIFTLEVTDHMGIQTARIPSSRTKQKTKLKKEKKLVV